MNRNESGFTLIELMIVIAIIAIIAAIAVPNLLAAKISANESNAISSLRNMVSAQAQFQASSSVDDDLDGTGEYGCLGEMAGVQALNQRVNGNGVAAPLDPAILSSTYSNIDANGMVTKSGYLLQVFLPDAADQGVAEGAGGLPSVNWDPNRCELLWCAYAWPADLSTTGNRSFFVNQRGEIFQTKMDVAQYSGAAAGPAYSAIFSVATMGAPLGINGVAALDGNTWVPVQ